MTVQIFLRFAIELRLKSLQDDPMGIVFASDLELRKGEVTPIVTLRDYLSEERSLVIPPWQREYTWNSGELNGEGEVFRLLNDLQEFVNSDQEQYLLGVITLAEIDKLDGISSRYIVDGQQRTVTLLILFMCCLEFIGREKKVHINHAEIITDLKRMIGIDRQGTSMMRVTFEQSEANTILEQIYTWAISPLTDLEKKNELLSVSKAKSETQEKLLETREYITERLEEKDHEKGFCTGKLIESLEKILSRVRIIQLTLSSESEALEVYDRMNDRGVRLSAADLIKNQLFMQTDSKDFATISSHWIEMVEILNNSENAKIKDPVFLVRSHASMHWGNTVKELSLAAKYERDYFSKKNSNSPVQFANQLKELARNGSTAYSGNIFESLYASQYLGVVQHFPLILAGTFINDDKAKSHFYNQVGMRAALAAFSKEFPPQLETIFPSWANKVYESGPGITIADLNDIYKLHAFKRNKNEEDSLAYEAERKIALTEQVDSWKFTVGSQKRKIRAALALMSWWLDKRLGAENEFRVMQYFTVKGATKWDVDHIGASAWEDSLNQNLDKDSIGNLVLLESKSNKKAQAKPPQNKVNEYRDSSIILTKLTVVDELAPKFDQLLRKIEKSCGINALDWDIESWNENSLSCHQNYYKGLLEGILFRAIEH